MSLEIQSAEPLLAPASAGMGLRRFKIAYGLLLALLLTALAVPLININRFQRRIAASLAESLGRPVRLDRIALTLLPLPGLSIENLVVGEDPAFGAEPFIRASEVQATLRFSSLWRRRIEFKRIRFTDPSINLVKLPDGRWNLAGILLQAARIEAAPTVQRRVGAAPRFPYIEARGARLNLKLGLEKTPISLTEAECALWLPNPGEWQLRVDGRPLRTDTSVSETGTFHLEGTLGRAASWTAVPLDLRAAWRNLPLGEAGRFVFARDGALRGTLTLTAAVRGTIGASAVQTSVHVAELRRADFVPAQTLTIDAECQASASDGFHVMTGIQCSWPPTPPDAGARFLQDSSPIAKTLALTGSIPDLRHLASASFEVGTPGISAATLLEWLRIASPRVDPVMRADGVLRGTASLHPSERSSEGPVWRAQAASTQARLFIPAVGPEPVFKGALSLQTVDSAHNGEAPHLVLDPVALDLGGRTPLMLEGSLGASGYTLHLEGGATPGKLQAFAAALPQIGDGLTNAVNDDLDPMLPVRVDLTSNRTWAGPRVWEPSPAVKTPPHRSRRRR